MPEVTCVALKAYGVNGPCGDSVFKWLGQVPLCSRHHSAAIKAASVHMRAHDAQWEHVLYGSREWDAGAAEVVYYVQRASDGLIKIGTSAAFPSRLSGLRSEHGEMRILLTHRGTIETERWAHRKFRRLRVEGEFFSPGKPLLDWIIKIRRRQPEASLLARTVPLAYLEAMSDSSSMSESWTG